MIRYFTALPLGHLDALDDDEALLETNASIVYRLSDDGQGFVVLRGNHLTEEEGE